MSSAGAERWRERRALWYGDDEIVRERMATLAIVREAYPLTFDPDMPVPLAVGVDVALQDALGLTPRQAKALMLWGSRRHSTSMRWPNLIASGTIWTATSWGQSQSMIGLAPRRSAPSTRPVRKAGCE